MRRFISRFLFSLSDHIGPPNYVNFEVYNLVYIYIYIYLNE